MNLEFGHWKRCFNFILTLLLNGFTTVFMYTPTVFYTGIDLIRSNYTAPENVFMAATITAERYDADIGYWTSFDIHKDACRCLFGTFKNSQYELISNKEKVKNVKHNNCYRVAKFHLILKLAMLSRIYHTHMQPEFPATILVFMIATNITELNWSCLIDKKILNLRMSSLRESEGTNSQENTFFQA